MGRIGFETGSDNEKIDEIQRQLDDINDSQINAIGGNENISIDSSRGSRNAASGDEGGVRSNQPIIHQITDVDSSGTPTGVFDKINLISSMIIVDYSTPVVDIELRFIQGTAKDGAKIKITPKVGRTLIIKSGGNILTSADITITDTEFYELIKHSEAETGVSGGAYKVAAVGNGGGGSTPPFTDATPLIFNAADITKLSKFSNALITTGTTRTYTLPDSSVILAGLGVPSQTWTGTNEFVGITTVIDSNFGIKDFSDNTKVINFDASLISTSTTRTYSLPNSTTTLAGLGVVIQQWTGSNDFVGSVTTRDSLFIVNQSDITKQMKFDLFGATSGQVLTLKSNHTGNRTLTFPDTTTSLAGLGTLSQTWTGTNIFAGFVNVRDVNYFIQNSADITKQVKWDLVSISTSTIRTLTLPNSSTTLAGLGVLSQTWTGTNNFVGITTMIDSNFGIKDFSDNTKVAAFDSSLISTSTTRTYSLPNSTTTLAGLGVVSQSWTGTNTFFGVTNFNGNIVLGNSASDSITFIGDTVGNITANVDNTDSIGVLSRTYAFGFFKGGVGIVEGYATGFKPSGQTNTGIVFTVPTAGGKTELRCSFQTGVSQIIVTEP